MRPPTPRESRPSTGKGGASSVQGNTGNMASATVGPPELSGSRGHGPRGARARGAAPGRPGWAEPNAWPEGRPAARAPRPAGGREGGRLVGRGARRRRRRPLGGGERPRGAEGRGRGRGARAAAAAVAAVGAWRGGVGGAREQLRPPPRARAQPAPRGGRGRARGREGDSCARTGRAEGGWDGREGGQEGGVGGGAGAGGRGLLPGR